MSYPAYPEYKDSGVEWLGEVPTHWEVKRLKHLLIQITDRANRRSNPIALENIESWSGCYIETESDFSGEGIAFQAGDLLFGKLRPYLAKVYLSKLPGEALGDFHVIRPSTKLVPEFAFHQLLQRQFISVVDGATHGAKMPRVGWEVMGNMPFINPPTTEQKVIASFLDHETARIDDLVEEQQRLIALLKEKRQAVISHAVTKGLDPEVPMKDSGVEWLGEVPKHWDVIGSKRFFRLVAEPAPKNNNFELLSVYTDIGVRPRKELEAKGNKASTTDGYWLVKQGDIVVNKLLAWMGAVGFSAYEGVTSPAYDILRPIRDMDSKFYHYLFRSKRAQQEFKRWSRGIMDMRLRLYFDELGRILVPFPPPEEQTKIVQYIESIENKYDGLINAASEQIKLLGERRSALISAAVTGKIDMRGWQPPADSLGVQKDRVGDEVAI
jgi:type I restriction enzyme S subunit